MVIAFRKSLNGIRKLIVRRMEVEKIIRFTAVRLSRAGSSFSVDTFKINGTITSRVVSYYLKFGPRAILLLSIFCHFFLLLSVVLRHCRTKIRMQVLNGLFQICVAEWANCIKFLTEPHSVNE